MLRFAYDIPPTASVVGREAAAERRGLCFFTQLAPKTSASSSVRTCSV